MAGVLTMRRKIYQVIAPNENDNIWGRLYDVFMVVVIFTSIIPMFFKTTTNLFQIIDFITVNIFIIDYLLRWIVAGEDSKDGSIKPYLKYPFTIMALVDMLSILPSLTLVNDSFKLLKTLRITRSLRVIRIFKALRYSRNFTLIVEVVKKTRASLTAVAVLCVMYVMASALMVFNIEPDTFDNYFDAVYWATVSLTTVGYGDIYPVSTGGRIVTMLSSIFGIAIVALPAGIITAGFMTELEKEDM